MTNNIKKHSLDIILQYNNKTLTDKQSDKIMHKLQSKFEKEFGT